MFIAVGLALACAFSAWLTIRVQNTAVRGSSANVGYGEEEDMSVLEEGQATIVRKEKP
jgi:hypothetical protein